MYEYDAFGGIRVLDEEGNPIPIEDAIPNPYTFTGREFDLETGLYYYRARYYDPSLGRFLQEDPILSFSYPRWSPPSSPIFIVPSLIKTPQNLHPYVYTLNNPLVYKDPFGLSAKEECSNPLDKCLKWVQKFREDCLLAIGISGGGCVVICVLGCIGSTIGYPLCVATCSSGCVTAYIIGATICDYIADYMEKVCYDNFGDLQK